MSRGLLSKVHWVVSNQFGLSPRLLIRSIFSLPSYIKDWFEFRKNYTGTLRFMPCLHDYDQEGGTTRNEYFLQDLLVARWIFQANPVHHVDIGSRVDGFVAHVACFRSIEVFDVRPIDSKIPGITFRQVDLMQREGLPFKSGGYCDSLSCLHALEHFGLGRYGDSVDPRGYAKGLANMVSLLKPGGIFYLSVPIGLSRVEFNANWIFDPFHIIKLAQQNDLSLKHLTVVATDGSVHEMSGEQENMDRWASEAYNLGILVFTKSEPTKNS